MIESVRKILLKLPVSFNQSIRNDKLANEVVKKVLSFETASYVDVGFHKGEMLKLALKAAPKGEHYGFDPLPSFYSKLKKELQSYVTLFEVAVSNKSGEEIFFYVESNPSFSGLKKRLYPKKEKITEITVKTDTLDNLLSEVQSIDLIKIDVEGGEYNVIEGARNILFKHKPIILFEHCAGAAEFYETACPRMWDLIVNQLGMSIYTMQAFVSKEKPLTKSQFQLFFDTGQELFFVAKFP
jgi:FkbM family methyltransferase